MSITNNSDYVLQQTKPQSNLTSLQDLPNSVIFKIFVFAGTGNNLPLVNKYYNQLLKFDPFSSDFEVWKNFPLVTEMVKEHYVVFFNSRLDFDLIDKKLNYYQDIFDEFTERTGEYLMDFGYHLLELVKNVQTFKGCSIAIDTNVLKNKFISKQSINKIVSWFKEKFMDFSSDDERIKVKQMALLYEHPNATLLSYDKLKGEATRRFHYIVLAFKACAYYADRMEEIRHPIPEKELIFVKDEAIAEFSIIKDDEKVFEDWADSYSRGGDLDFYSFRYPHGAPKYMPYEIYKHGITTVEKFELVEVLFLKYNLRIEFIDEMLVKTFSNFTPDNLVKLDYIKISLNKIVYPFRCPCLPRDRQFMPADVVLEEKPLPPIIYLQFPELAQILHQSTIIKLFQLYDVYSKVDVKPYGFNCDGTDILEDIKLTIKQLLAEYFRNRDVACDKIWKFVNNSKNKSLKHLLNQYSFTQKYSKASVKATEKTCTIL